MTAIACGSHVPLQEENKTADVIILKLHLLSNRVSLFYYAVKKTLLHAGSVMQNAKSQLLHFFSWLAK